MTNKEAYDQVVNAPHEAHLSHELIAAAAAYEAAKAYNNHKEKSGETVSHSTAKEIMAAAGGALITRIFETKGLDAIDNYKAKKNVEEQAEGHYDDHLKHHHRRRD